MAFEVIMPQLGLTMEEGTVSKWFVKEGDTVQKGDPLLEITTDKLTNQVNSEFDGPVSKIVAQEGESYPVQAVLAYIGPLSGEESAPVAEQPEEVAKPLAEEKMNAPKRAPGERIIASPYARRIAKERGIDLAHVQGTGQGGRIVFRDVDAAKASAPVAPAAEEAAVKMSPLARKVAKELGIQPSSVTTNSYGRVLAQDLLNYMQSGSTPTPVAETAQPEEWVQMDNMRKAIAQNMFASYMTSPMVSFNLSVDMTEMKAYRDQLKKNDIKVSFTDLLVKFVAKALMEYPALNCTVDGDRILYKHYVNMGVAVALENGLMVPNIKNAQEKSITDISAEVKRLASAAREGGLTLDEMQGGTFTITNIGMYGVESFTPIINQPEVAILGVNTIEDKVVVRNGEMVIRPMMTLSLTADHRVVDGSVAAQFMQRVKELMENPALMLA